MTRLQTELEGSCFDSRQGKNVRPTEPRAVTSWPATAPIAVVKNTWTYICTPTVCINGLYWDSEIRDVSSLGIFIRVCRSKNSVKHYPL